MALKPTTLGLLLVALILAGVVYLTQSQGPSSSDATDANGGLENAGSPTANSASGEKLFAVEEKQIQSFTLKTQLRSLSFQRDDSGTWQMTEPEAAPANDAAIAYLLNLLATGKSDRTFKSSTAQQEEYGFHQPMADIEFKLDNQDTHRLVVGGYDFNRSLLYAQVDPTADPAGDLNVLLISPDFDNAVNRPLADWKAQPPSTSPSPSPTSSPNPSP